MLSELICASHWLWAWFSASSTVMVPAAAAASAWPMMSLMRA